MIAAAARFVTRLRDETRGLALLEFAFGAPIILLMALTGAELVNYVTAKMRVSQVALHLADNAARIGSGSQLQAKTISEADINDLLTGAGLQAGGLNIYGRGRVIISSLEPMANPNTTGKYQIRWQRCRGALTSHASTYGVQGATNIDGMGPAGRLVTAMDDGATMFVEVYYQYSPIVQASRATSTDMDQIASMVVRDRRDLSDDSTTTNLHPNGIYKVNGVTPSTC